MSKRFGLMLDMSRNAVMKPEELKKFAALIKSFGYNMIQLYTEDTYEVDGEPYFGYMRGRYTQEELCDLVNYCDSIGVELIPCIQTLAHLNQAFMWKKYKDIRDTGDILLVGDERTYDFIENMFKSLRKCFKSEYVHIGMDEAHMLGLGKYLDIHGFRNRFDILSEHLSRVIEIAKKYGFKPMMWSDMFFRLANHGEYYTLKDKITDEIVSKCPEDVDLVFWDYYHNTRDIYDNMIDQHKKFKGDIWFAGGIWSWTGFTPFNKWSIESMKVAMESCNEKNIDNIFFTMWGDDGKECSFYSLLPAIFAIRKMYEGITDMDTVKKLFKETVGEDFDAMMALDIPNFVDGNHERRALPSKVMLYNDPMFGIYDSCVTEGVGEEYKAHSKTLYEYAKDSKYGYLFEFEAALCDTLSVKYELGARTRKAYLAGDKDALRALLDDYAKASELLDLFHKKYRTLWYRENKPNGFDVQELRLGGTMLRLRSSRERIEAYLNGEIEALEEFNEKLLDYNVGVDESTQKLPKINSFKKSSTVNILSW